MRLLLLVVSTATLLLFLPAADRDRHSDIVGYRWGDLKWLLGARIEDTDLTEFEERSEELKEVLERERRSPDYARSFYLWDVDLRFGKTMLEAAGVRLLFRSGRLVTIEIEADSDQPQFKYLHEYMKPRYRGCEYYLDDFQPTWGPAIWNDSDGDWLSVAAGPWENQLTIKYYRLNADDPQPLEIHMRNLKSYPDTDASDPPILYD